MKPTGIIVLVCQILTYKRRRELSYLWDVRNIRLVPTDKEPEIVTPLEAVFVAINRAVALDDFVAVVNTLAEEV